MRNFIILGVARTGSGAIADLINLHPRTVSGICWLDNIPHKIKIKVATKALSGDFRELQKEHQQFIKAKLNSMTELIGFKIDFSASNKYIYHPKYAPTLWFDNLFGFIDWIKKTPDLSVVHITRENNIEWLKSYYLSKKTRLYEGEKYPYGIKVSILKRQAIKRIKSKKFIDEKIGQLKHTNPYCLVKYEDLDQNNKSVAEKAITFLNCNFADCNLINFHRVKQSRGPAKNYIKNYAELFIELEKTNCLYSYH